MTLYELSKKSRTLLSKLQQILDLHLVRYSMLVDSSPRGENCKYARHTRRFLAEEKDKECAILRQIGQELVELSETLSSVDFAIGGAKENNV